MTEQELRDNKFRADVENALHQNRSLTMIAQTIWELTKAYADARESKSANKIAEIRRLCKAFLYDLPCSHNVSVIGEFLDAYADNKILDEFKKTVVVAKDTEIAELKAQVEGLKTDMQHSRLIEAAQVKESNELKAEIKYWKDRWEAQNKAHDAEFSSIIAQNAENKRLNAEVERLREGIQDAVDWLNNPDDNVDFDELLQSLLSPAPVTETQNEDQS